jgi:phenylalanyl-tRNA synthetase alpha chain
MPSGTDQLDQLRKRALAELADSADAESLEAWRIRYLGSKGAVREAMGRIKELPREQRKDYGRLANEVKTALESAFDARKVDVESSAGRRQGPGVDMSLPGLRPDIGHRHLITQTIEEITEIFARMGFEVAYGPEVEDERHNFNALNIPPSHPARDELDNFYIAAGDEAAEPIMLRSQTSTVQIRVMENREPPVRVVSPGRVYRPDTVDATHSFMFHQLEGLYVDEGVSMADLRSDVDQFCKAYFDPDTVTRFRPSFFPFTEPSAEVDILMHRPDGGEFWMELGGCGMVDPNVLEAVGYDSERYTGWAFGLGIERMVMRKHRIPDIRLLFDNDVRFLRQF